MHGFSTVESQIITPGIYMVERSLHGFITGANYFPHV